MKAILTGVNEFLSIHYTFIVQFGTRDPHTMLVSTFVFYENWHR